MVEIGKTTNCVACYKPATEWKGKVIRSREYVSAGFCEEHKNIECPNTFGKKDCYGLYNKSMDVKY